MVNSESENSAPHAERDRGGPRTQVFRKRHGRLLGGVCAGLPRIAGLGTNGLRLAFLVTALFGGIGVMVYCACWLVIPLDEEDAEARETRAIVMLAWGAGGLLAAVTLAAFGAAATAFGLGWAVFGVAAITLLASLLLRQAVPTAACSVAIAALTLPATAVAISSIDVPLQFGSRIEAPANTAAFAYTTYSSGLGTMLIDLRHTRLPAGGAVTLHVRAGVRRTIVALPTGQCVHLRVHYDIHPLASTLATLITRRYAAPFEGVVLFGSVYEGGNDFHGLATSDGDGTGPTLTIVFTSQGGSLYVRDYPNSVKPSEQPSWPGFAVTPEPRPTAADMVGDSKAEQRREIRSWARRHRVQLASQKVINSLMEGPCNR